MYEDKVQEAKEELKNAINCWDHCGKWPSPDSEEYYLFESSRSLLNALEEKESVHKTEQSLPDIWKDVSELPEDYLMSDYLLKWGSDDIELVQYDEDKSLFCHKASKDQDYPIEDLVKYCLLKDFINQQEQTTKKVAELEKLIKEKLNKDN